MQNLKVEYWKDGRFVIIDGETGEIMDDAQGYGYKDKKKAAKALWWKFKGGKEKINEEKQQFNAWLKQGNNKQIVKEINEILECCFKEIARGETTFEEIIKQVEKERNIKIPKFVIKNILN